jgi:hypothetical protein
VTPRSATVVAATVAAVLLSAAPTTATDGAAPGDIDPDTDWRTVLDRAVDASATSAFDGRLVVIAFNGSGPNLTELEVTQGTGGGMRIGRSESWTVGRDADEAFYVDTPTGTLLRLGNVERTPFSVDDLLGKYEVSRQGTATLQTGSAVMVSIRERGAAHDRERLYVDDATGLVVRRETFDDDGRPLRLVAFTALELTDRRVDTPDGMTAASAGPARALSGRGLEILRSVGWSVPEQLPAGFRLRAGYARQETDGSSVHLVYSDGLYTLSVYEQFGAVDRRSLAGAVQVTTPDVHVWRWAGSEPQKMVWTGDEMTFTAISDAPLDQVLEAVIGFPNDPPPTASRRLLRGLQRAGAWLWPFD